MNRFRLKEILSIPSCVEYENLIKDYLIGYGIKNGIRVNIDVKGNVYLIKGNLSEGGFPCVTAHLDTVYKSQIPLIKANGRLTIKEDIYTNEETILYVEGPGGIGGDDKCGVAISLELLEKCDKLIAAFFVEEECGCKGSKNSDKSIFNNIDYVIGFDAPSNNWFTRLCNGVKIHDDDDFIQISSILDKCGVDNISVDPFTDVKELRLKYGIPCFNLFAGYYGQHSGINEYVVVEDVEKAIEVGYEIIKKFKV
jgi:tripeptide aminopeptidase